MRLVTCNNVNISFSTFTCFGYILNIAKCVCVFLADRVHVYYVKLVEYVTQTET